MTLNEFLGEPVLNDGTSAGPRGEHRHVMPGVVDRLAAAEAAVMLADMPLVSAAMISDLVARYRATGAPLVVSDYEGVHAPPMLYDRALFAELVAALLEREK